MPHNMFIVTMISAALLGASLVEADEPRKLQVERVKQTPDLTQTNRRAGFAGGGEQFCCPVAVSNALMLWAGQGATRLLPLGNTSKRFDQQREIVVQLAAPNLMNTSLDNGTGVRDMVRGTQRYVTAANYELASIEYYGWRPGPSEQAKLGDLPEPKWMRNVLRNPYGAVWLNIGWYKTPSREKYQRIGGHWVLLAAFNPSNESRFIVFDPSPRAGAKKHADRITLRRLNAGLLEGKKHGLPTTAVGRYRVDGKLAMKRSADLAIIDAAVAMILAVPQ